MIKGNQMSLSLIAITYVNVIMKQLNDKKEYYIGKNYKVISNSQEIIDIMNTCLED